MSRGSRDTLQLRAWRTVHDLLGGFNGLPRSWVAKAIRFEDREYLNSRAEGEDGDLAQLR
jgi:hypothetical protein